jgi:NADH-quinone oxidoreductase subunit M
MKQAFGHVVVTSTDEAAGEVAMGFRAQIPQSLGPIGDHALSTLLLLPLAGALALLAVRASGRRGSTATRWIALGVTGLELLLALWAYLAFVPEVSRLDGNDGLQLVERSVWIRALGVEYFVGVDGTSIALVLLCALVAFVGVAASFGVERHVEGYFAAYLVLFAGAMGAFIALDLVLFFVAWQVALVALVVLVGAWGGERRAFAATKLALFGLVGGALMLVAFALLSSNADRTFLVDGSPTARSFAIPELARVAFASKGGTLLGVSFVKVVYGALFVAFALRTPVVPLHTWLADTITEAPTGVGVAVAGFAQALGPYALLRIGFTVLPEATRWAAGTIVALGVVGLFYGALCAMAQRDLRRTIAYGTVAQMGFVLVGFGSLTPQGIAGGIVQLFAQGAVGAMLLALVGALDDRVRTRDLVRFGGLASEMPVFAAFVGVALLASAGVPGFAGFWGETLGLFGAFPMHPVLASFAALGIVVHASWHIIVARKLLFGKVDPAWRADPRLEPFGGKLPDLGSREAACVAPLAVVALLLGVWPVPLLSQIANGVRDVSALVDPPGPDQVAAAPVSSARSVANVEARRTALVPPAVSRAIDRRSGRH